MITVLTNLSCLAAADRPQAQRADASDADHDPDRSMNSDEERDYTKPEPAGQRAGILKRHTAFFTRCVIFCCLDGLRTSVTRAQSMGTLITASVWPIVLYVI